MMEDKTVDILGTLYTIHFDVPDEKMPEGADGCMDQSIHTIKIAEFESDRNSVMDLDSYSRKGTGKEKRICHKDLQIHTDAQKGIADGIKRLKKGR